MMKSNFAGLLLLILLAGEVAPAHGGGAAPEVREARNVRIVVAQSRPAGATAAASAAKSSGERTPEEKKRIKSAVVLLSVLSGIALSGLLLIIAAVAIRGLQRKLAGPTRLDREPADLLASVPQPPSAPAPPIDPSTQETRAT